MMTARDSRATGDVWRAYHARLHAFVARRVGDRDTADDIVQDVFLRTHARLGELRDDTKLQSWLYQIARNAIVDHYRRRRVDYDAADEIPSETEGDARDAVRELAECLRPMIDLLPAHYRDALVLSELDGVTQREIAKREGISLSGAKSRVQRARAMLKELLDECCRFEFDQRGQLVDYVPRACEGDDACSRRC